MRRLIYGIANSDLSIHRRSLTKTGQSCEGRPLALTRE